MMLLNLVRQTFRRKVLSQFTGPLVRVHVTRAHKA